MAPKRLCPDCGSLVPADAPRGLCPECLLGAAVGGGTDGSSDATAAHTSASGGVLDSIAQTVGPVPRVLLPDTDIQGAQGIAEALVASMASQQDPVVGTITISAGVATLRGLEDDATTLLRRADAALYEAKGRGRNRVCVEY